MKVTPVKKNFGKHKLGDVFDLPDQVARLFIKVGKLRPADAPEQAAAPTYQTRMMQAAPAVSSVVEADAAPYGYKADGTPRKRPAPKPKAE